MTPQQAKEIVDARYKHTTEGKSLTAPQKLDKVNRIVVELRQYHNYAVLINGTPVKGVTLDPQTQGPIYHVG